MSEENNLHSKFSAEPAATLRTAAAPAVAAVDVESANDGLPRDLGLILLPILPFVALVLLWRVRPFPVTVP